MSDDRDIGFLDSYATICRMMEEEMTPQNAREIFEDDYHPESAWAEYEKQGVSQFLSCYPLAFWLFLDWHNKERPDEAVCFPIECRWGYAIELAKTFFNSIFWNFSERQSKNIWKTDVPDVRILWTEVPHYRRRSHALWMSLTDVQKRELFDHVMSVYRPSGISSDKLV